jgi:hypothetical protein
MAKRVASASCDPTNQFAFSMSPGFHLLSIAASVRPKSRRMTQ